MNENQEFRDIVKNTFFYSFFVDDKFIGCIYYFEKDGKLYMSGFSTPGNHLNNVECVKKSFEWFNCDIYAETEHKTAIFCLYRCGFKKVSKNLYKYERR